MENQNLLMWISLGIALIGSITGVISLIWHIKNNKPKLKLERAFFERQGFADEEIRGMQHIKVRIKLRNLSNRSTTLEDVWIQVANYHQTPKFFQEVMIPANSSKTLEFMIEFEEDDYRDLFDEKGELYFGLVIVHTFGTIRKRKKASFKSGCYGLA